MDKIIAAIILREERSVHSRLRIRMLFREQSEMESTQVLFLAFTIRRASLTCQFKILARRKKIRFDTMQR